MLNVWGFKGASEKVAGYQSARRGHLAASADDQRGPGASDWEKADRQGGSGLGAGTCHHATY